MFLHSLRAFLISTFFASSFVAIAAPLHICADPDNLPFSDRSLRGFDNHIAMVLAQALHREPIFVWSRSRRGFLREQFNKNACDMLMGVPEGMRGVATTHSYYRSSYVFVTRQRDRLQIATFDDPQLNGRRIGLQALEEDLSPPSLPLIRNGHAAQIVAFESFGALAPDIVRAVADGRVGVAVVWGPLAGYFAARQPIPLSLLPVAKPVDSSGIPMAFSLAIAVHRQDTALLDALNIALSKIQPQIDRILRQFNIPVLSPGKEQP